MLHAFFAWRCCVALTSWLLVRVGSKCKKSCPWTSPPSRAHRPPCLAPPWSSPLLPSEDLIKLSPLTLRRPTVCPVVPGYSASPDVDRNGDDILNAGSMAAAAAKCDLDSTCRTFNTNGWVKRSAAPVIPASGSCLYTKVPTGRSASLGGRGGSCISRQRSQTRGGSQGTTERVRHVPHPLLHALTGPGHPSRSRCITAAPASYRVQLLEQQHTRCS